MSHVRPQRWFLALVAVGAVTFAAPQDAAACSFAAAAWGINHRGTTVVTAPDLPLIVTLVGYDNPHQDPPELTNSTFMVELRDAGGAPVAGGVSIMAGVSDLTGRLVFTPDEPLEVGAAYQLAITLTEPVATNDTNDPVNFGVEVLAELGAPDPLITSTSAREQRRGADELCCETPEEDSTCAVDSCGDYQYGEECRLCWPTSFAYPISGTVEWQIASDLPSGFVDHRVYRVDGDEEELVGTHLTPLTGHATWPHDHAGPHCFRVEVDDVIRGLSASSDIVCLDAADVDRREHEHPETSEFEDRCVPGTIDEPEPVPQPDDDTDETPDAETPAGMKDPADGCCATANGATPATLPLLALLCLGMLGLRRHGHREAEADT